MALNIPAAVTAMQTDLGRVRTALGFASDAEVDAALAAIAAIEASAAKLRSVLQTYVRAKDALTKSDESQRTGVVQP